jgi:pimeloyl-ACP methyl ester carboxylesterase
MDEDSIQVEGLKIAFRRAGGGRPLVLLHGGASDSRVWSAQLADLSDQFQVVAWDAPGCGGSDDPPPDFGLADYADCLASFIQALGIDHPHVLGHSFGGGLAMQLAVQHPDVPRSLIVAAGYAGWAGSLPPGEVAVRLESALALADDGATPITPESIPGLFSQSIRSERMDELATVMSEVRATGTRVMARAFAAADLRDVLARIHIPTLLLYGGNDERAPREVAETLHAGIPNSILVTMPDFGHEWYFESPATFNAEVRRFLSSIE